MIHSVKRLVSLEFKSIPAAHEYINSLDDQISVIEFTPHAPGKALLLFESAAKPKAVAKKDLIDQCTIENPHPNLLKSLYGLKNSPLKETLGVIECSTISKALLVAHHLSQISAVELIEIDSGRSLTGKSLIYFTGPAESTKSTIEILKKQKDKRLISFRVLPKTNSIIRRYFQWE